MEVHSREETSIAAKIQRTFFFEWTNVRIEVEGSTARLFVHGAEQPSLIVDDLFLGVTRGTVALWIGLGTEAYFSNLVISPE